MPTRSHILVLLACVFTLGVAGCGGCGDEPDSQAVDYEKALARAPAKLASLYDRGDELIPGGIAAFQEELDRLRGHPVVANIWASWCLPCREEFPEFQAAVAEFGTDVAFLGVDSEDNDDAARTFLDEFPVPYPSVTDPDREVGDELRLAGLPGTAFYDARGELLYLKQGPYRDHDELFADIERYVG